MSAGDRTWEGRRAGLAFWSLAGLSAVLLFAFLAALAASGLTPVALSRTCTAFLRMMSPAPRMAVTALFILGAGCLGAGVGQLFQQAVMTHRLMRALRRRMLPAPPESLRGILGQLRLVDRFDVPVDDDVYAFSVGLWHPRIVCSTGMLDLLEADEFRAMLLHEADHVRHRDALKVAISRALARGLFFLPLAQDLARSYLLLKELAADEHAIRHMGDRWPLASALYQLARRAPDLPSSTATAGSAGDTALRVQHVLTSPHVLTVPLARSPVRTMASAIAIVILLTLSAGLVDMASAAARMPVCPAFLSLGAPHPNGRA
jgi:Zn-dependent protease with chaperone function